MTTAMTLPAPTVIDTVGGVLVVMVIDATSVQVPVVPVTVYVVVVVGLTTMLAVVRLVSVPQTYDVAPVAVNVTLVPGHTVGPGEADIVTGQTLQASVVMARLATSITTSATSCLLKSNGVFMVEVISLKCVAIGFVVRSGMPTGGSYPLVLHPVFLGCTREVTSMGEILSYL